LHAERIGTTTLAAILFYTVVTTVRVMYRLMQRVRAISERIGNTKLAAIWFYTVVTTERVMYRLMQRVRAISERIGTTTLTAILCESHLREDGHRHIDRHFVLHSG
jgi:hypothetical protein